MKADNMLRVKSKSLLKTECFLQCKKVKFDAISSDSLGTARDYYDEIGFKYIGSGKIIFYSGQKTILDKMHHFFIKR